MTGSLFLPLGPCALLWVSPDEPWPLRHLHRWGRVAFSGARSSQDLCGQPTGQAQPRMFGGRRKPQVHPGIVLFLQGGLRYSIDVLTKLQLMWRLGLFVSAVSVSASWCAWPGPCWEKPKSWFWTRQRPLSTWRRTHSSSQQSAHSLKTAPFWPSLTASTPSWTTPGMSKQHPFRNFNTSAAAGPLVRWTGWTLFFRPTSMTHSLKIKWKVSFQTPRTCNNLFSLFVTCWRQSSSPPFLRHKFLISAKRSPS